VEESADSKEAAKDRNVMTEPIAKEIAKVREELAELEAYLPGWDSDAHGLSGSKKYRGVARRIVL
jgi:hypothetical protein